MSQVKLNETDKARLRVALKKLDGLSPYNVPSNQVINDGYYARAIEQMYGAPLEELRKLVEY